MKVAEVRAPRASLTRANAARDPPAARARIVRRIIPRDVFDARARG
jgi:hypothetical protein